MNVCENRLKYSVGWVARLPQQSTVLKIDSYSNLTFNPKSKIYSEIGLVGL